MADRHNWKLIELVFQLWSTFCDWIWVINLWTDFVLWQVQRNGTRISSLRRESGVNRENSQFDSRWTEFQEQQLEQRMEQQSEIECGTQICTWTSCHLRTRIGRCQNRHRPVSNSFLWTYSSLLRQRKLFSQGSVGIENFYDRGNFFWG